MRTTSFLLSVLFLVSIFAPNADSHSGRRFEVVVTGNQLAVQGYISTGSDDQGGNPRPYFNAIHDHWSNISTIAIADLPGFDIFSQANSYVGSGSAELLQGSDLTLNLQGALKWENPPASGPFGTPQLVNLPGGETITIGDNDEVVNTATNGVLTLATNISSAGAEDLDLDYSIEMEPSNVIYALEWVLSTTEPGIADSESLFTLISPDTSNNGLHHQSLHLEKYLSTPLVPGDYDRHGSVDAGDHTAWKLQFGETVPTLGIGADGNRNGVVDDSDYTVWLAHLQQGQSGTSSIPEPSTALLLWLTFIFFCGRRTRTAK